MDKPFIGYINKMVTTKDKRLLIVGQENAFEYYLASNQYQSVAEMVGERVWASVVYEPTQDKIFIMGGIGNKYNNVDTCE